MHKINRRHLIASLGILGSSALLTGCGDVEETGNRPVEKPIKPEAPAPIKCWEYVELDPKSVAEEAYRIYPEGGCMYAVVGSVIHALADLVGEPFRSFPIEMMRYGNGGMGGWGTLCGVANGGAALIGMFQNEKSKKRRDELISEYALWYERTALPQYKPAKAEWAENAEPSTAESVLCHVSLSKWCKNSGCETFSMDKKERCRRLSADGAMKIVEILNANCIGSLQLATMSPEVKTCIKCHGPLELSDSMGKMDCRSCHQFAGPHPSLSESK